MFKKLLSNLPFNPSLINQVSFYSKRLRAEGSIRKMGFIFMILSLAVQGFAAVAPSEPTLASSANDLIRGGINSSAEALSHCQNNAEIRTIFAHYGVSCDALTRTTDEYVHTRSWDGQLYSLGRLPYGKQGEQAINIAGTTYFARPVWTWGDYSFRAIQGTTDNGLPFMIMLDCGNIVSYGPPRPELPPPPPPPPAPEKVIACANLGMSVRDKSRVSTGSSVSVRGQATGRNLGPNEQVVMYYELTNTDTDEVVEKQHGEGIQFSGTTAQDPVWRVFDIKEEGNYTFKLKVTYNGGSRTATGSEKGDCLKQIVAEKEPPCDDKENPLECLVLHKNATNQTQDIPDANGTQARAGDVVVYTLSVKNTSTNTPIEGFVVEESIADILDYAKVLDLYGGTQDENHIVRWPEADIAPGETLEQKIKVQIKDPIPATPVSASNPGTFDLTLTNVYGDTVNITVRPPATKAVESTTQSLPNTGPGETLAAAFVITVVAGYFFARTRLMTKELDIVRSDYAVGGTQ